MSCAPSTPCAASTRSMKALVPERAMVPRPSTISSRFIPMPLSSTVRRRCSLSAIRVIRGFGSSPRRPGPRSLRTAASRKHPPHWRSTHVKLLSTLLRRQVSALVSSTAREIAAFTERDPAEEEAMCVPDEVAALTRNGADDQDLLVAVRQHRGYDRLTTGERALEESI